MLCALTVRTLKPGTFDDFRQAFMGDVIEDSPPEGWVRFDMLRNTENPDEVICFGFFDGTTDELRSSSDAIGRARQQEAIAPYVAATGTDGLFEVVEDFAVTR
jgi:heme-degrading monooxygenase HmoA